MPSHTGHLLLASTRGGAYPGAMEDRYALEEQIAHLIRMVEDLSDEVTTLSSRLRRAEARVDHLRERAAEDELAKGSEIPLGDQRPPHW